jgi:hypothetical protein
MALPANLEGFFIRMEPRGSVISSGIGFVFNKAKTLAFAWAIFIFILCATPGEYIPEAWWMQVLSIDKLVHAILFFVLYALLLLYLKRDSKPVYLKALWFLLCVFYGMALELMQARLFSNRSSDWYDVLANTAGVVIAFFFTGKLESVLKGKVVKDY